jgi:hypothetical protein
VWGLGELQRIFLLKTLVDIAVANKGDVVKAAAACVPGVNDANIQVGGTGDEMPNIFSIFHLVAESLVAEHVFPTLSCGADISPIFLMPCLRMCWVSHEISFGFFGISPSCLE